ncbi:GOLPH3/VPS74 family protein [Cellulomonas fengjieae]|uniref:GPP34 family phosphoprotein n=1 Tax=Cellulomonas fengjieae TaxID=2819978 RepID=A0ABS3SBD6_9CELL|nr:GPP34 family phosphoprotein [Cellulomonas fengjieae]MBO3083062.1 GPP34 family phosphoprotein [Cellulomonas fengjieae]QVI65568.1 GPP34 family phosphoprotein [Cellulomonas fengjieae]
MTWSAAEPTLPEDLLLLMFQPGSRAISGGDALLSVLAGAVLADLALDGRVSTTKSTGTVMVEAVQGRAPTDEILRRAWAYLADRPRGIQAALAAIGPTVRTPLLARLVARGDIREQRHGGLGPFSTTTLMDGGSARRARLLSDVRDVVIGGTEPTPRVAALAGLLWGSGTLPELHRSSAGACARQLDRGQWVVGAAAAMVTRTTNAIIAGSVVIAAGVPARAR